MTCRYRRTRRYCWPPPRPTSSARPPATRSSTSGLQSTLCSTWVGPTTTAATPPRSPMSWPPLPAAGRRAAASCVVGAGYPVPAAAERTFSVEPIPSRASAELDLSTRCIRRRRRRPRPGFTGPRSTVTPIRRPLTTWGRGPGEAGRRATLTWWGTTRWTRG